MKILFLNYEYPPLGGGAGVATEVLLREWAKDPSLEVHLVTAAVGDALEHIRIGGKVFVHRVPIGKNPDRLHSQSLRDIGLYTWRATLFLWRFMRAEQQKSSFDVTLAFFGLPCGLMAYLIKKVFTTPYVVSLRGADVPGFSEKYALFYLFAKPLVRFLWHRAEAVIPNSAGIAELARKTDSQQTMQTIENGVDTETFCPDLTQRRSDAVVFLSTSRLTPRKGIHHLIEAFAHAAGTAKVPIELHLIGDGEQRGVLEARARTLGIADQVKFFGRIEHGALADYYRRAHVFVLPSQNEGMSNSTLEALASGLPLIVSGTGGMEELVHDGENGYIIDPENTVDFAGKIKLLAEERALRDAQGEASRKQSLRRSWAVAARAFRQALERASLSPRPKQS